MSTSILQLDGSFGEGGGQILRTSLALSLLTGRPFRLRNIRAGRERPGLQPQHLACVHAAAKIGAARVRGDSLKSKELLFEPGEIVSGNFRFAIGTAGATSLLLHTIYLPLALRSDAPCQVALQGGTHVSASPCFHFLDVTWRRYMALLGLNMALQMVRPGFYPRGGGIVEVEIQPCTKLRGLTLAQRFTDGCAIDATGVSAVAGLPQHIAERQARQARERFAQAGLEIEIHQETWAGGPGSVLGITLATQPAPTFFFGLGARGKPAERVADEAVDQALSYLRAGAGAVDAHSADQLVLPLSLAEGPSEFRVAEVTTHLLTNIAVIRKFVERQIVCAGAAGELGRVLIGPFP